MQRLCGGCDGILTNTPRSNNFSKTVRARLGSFMSKHTKLVADNTVAIHKTISSQCLSCGGKGVIKKLKVDGTPYKKYTKCVECDGEGFIYNDMAKLAGFNQRPEVFMM